KVFVIALFNYMNRFINNTSTTELSCGILSQTLTGCYSPDLAIISSTHQMRLPRNSIKTIVENRYVFFCFVNLGDLDLEKTLIE
ncbi:unnamed protein product, partial [Brachionus calyciflorus]